MAPQKTTTPEPNGSSTEASAGKKAGAKRPAPGQAVNIPTRRVSTHSDSSFDSNPSRPGSSGTGGYHLNNFSYYQISQDAARACNLNIQENSIDPHSVEFRLMADAYHIGWQRFKHADTAKALIHLGQGCAASWTDRFKRKERGNYEWVGDKSKIHVYHNNFIKGLIHTTPAIGKQKLAADEGETYAFCCLEDTYKGSIDNVLITRNLFHIVVPDIFADHLVDAYNRHEDDRYQQLRTLLAACFFHELVHAWVFFLIGSVSADTVRIGTPEEYKAPWDQVVELGHGKGESGYFIEGEIFGATLDVKPWFQPIGSSTARSQLVCTNAKQQQKVVPAAVCKAFNKDPKGYDIRANIMALFNTPVPKPPRQAEERPAKRQKKGGARINRGKKTKKHAWHIAFDYNADRSSVLKLVTTQATPV